MVRINVDSIQLTKATQRSARHAALKKKSVLIVPVIGLFDDDDEATKKSVEKPPKTTRIKAPFVTMSSVGQSFSLRHSKQKVEEVVKSEGAKSDRQKPTATTSEIPKLTASKASWEAKNFVLPIIGATLRILAKEIANVLRINNIDLDACGLPIAILRRGIIKRIAHIDH